MTWNLHIAGPDTRAVFDLKGQPDALAAWAPLPAFPRSPNTVSVDGAQSLLWIGPEHWLLLAPLDAETSLAGALRPDVSPHDASVVLISDTLAFFRIAGPDADALLAIASPLDIHPSAFPAGGAAFSEAFGLKALIVRVPGGFDLAVDRSYATFVSAMIRRATA